jgi:hypothetical protein
LETVFKTIDGRALRFAHGTESVSYRPSPRLLPRRLPVVNDLRSHGGILMYVQPFEGPFSSGSLSPLGGGLADEASPFGQTPPMPSDTVARLANPWLSDGAAPSPYGMLGPLMGMLSQLMQMLQSLMGYQGCGNERFFRNADGASSGDPHLSFNGNRWSSNASQPDLLNSNSFPGGFHISTQTTPPNGKGVAWNRSATVALGGGATTVTLSANGESTITSNGQTRAIARGETLRIGNGETVVANANGSLCISARNGEGGSIATTLTSRANGVDVDVTAHDVELGGALVNGENPVPDMHWEPRSLYN